MLCTSHVAQPRPLCLPLIDRQVRRVQHFEKLQRDGKGESLRNAEIHFTGGDVRCRRPPARRRTAQLRIARLGPAHSAKCSALHVAIYLARLGWMASLYPPFAQAGRPACGALCAA